MLWSLTLKRVKWGPVHPAGHVNVIHEALYVQRQVGGVGAHQLLQFLALLVQPQQSPRVVPYIKFVLALELLAEVIDQRLVEIAPPEVWVERSGEDLVGSRSGTELVVFKDTAKAGKLVKGSP